MKSTKPRRRRTIWVVIGIILLVAYIGLRKFEYTVVYQPDRVVGPAVRLIGYAEQDFFFAARDGTKLNGRFYPANTNSLHSQLAILVCHGNGGNMGYLDKLCSRLLMTGANVLLFDYRGYGRSEGSPSESGTYQDAEAAYQWLLQSGFAATNILVYGQSLGGGPATELATREPLGGLVLESTYTSVPDVGARLYPWLPVHLLSSIKYDTHSKLPRLKIPVLLMHSHGDDLIPYQQAELNYAAANEPKLLFEIHGFHACTDALCSTGVDKLITALETARAHSQAVKF